MDKEIEKEITIERISIDQIKEVFDLTSVRLLMIIILCGYVGYKVTDVFSLYAQDVMNYDQVESAQVGTFLLYTRPVIGVVIGFLADRTQTTYWLMNGFFILLAGCILIASGVVTDSLPLLFFSSIIIVSIGVNAIRCLYFSVMEKGKIPLVLTGTAVGMISIVGYTPDIFAGPLMGYLLDNSPGILGHQHVFMMLAVFSLIGGLSAWRYYRLYGDKK